MVGGEGLGERGVVIRVLHMKSLNFSSHVLI